MICSALRSFLCVEGIVFTESIRTSTIPILFVQIGFLLSTICLFVPLLSKIKINF